MNKKILYGASLVIPFILAFFVWVAKGSNYVLEANIKVAQFIDSKGHQQHPLSIFKVERWIDQNYLFKVDSDTGSKVIFARRNPDFPKNTLYIEISGDQPEKLNTLFEKVLSNLKTQSEELIGTIISEKKKQVVEIKKVLKIMNNFNAKTPANLEQSEQFMNTSKELVQIGERLETIQIALDPSYTYQTHSIQKPSIKKKSSDLEFNLSVWLGACFLAFILIFLSHNYISKAEDL